MPLKAIKQYTLILGLFMLGMPNSDSLGNLQDDALQAILERQYFNYKASYGSNNQIGELIVSVAHQDSEILVTAEFKISNALAKLFLDPYIIQNRFVATPEKLLLLNGQTRKPNSSEIISSYAIDRERGTIQYSKQKSISLPADVKIDTSDFPIVMAISDLESLAGSDVLIVSDKKISLYHYQKPVREDVVIKGQKYRTWKITRNKLNEEGRQVIVWLTDDYRRIPIKVVSTKRGADTVFELMEPPPPVWH